MFVLNILSKYLLKIINLRFLPDKLQYWLFSTGPRVIELSNAFIMFGFAFIFFAGGDGVFKVDLYEEFLVMKPPILAVLLFIVSIAQLVTALLKNSRATIISGCLLIFSGLIWAVITGRFWSAYPPMSTGMTTYPVWAIVCALAGRNLITLGKHVGDNDDGER